MNVAEANLLMGSLDDLSKTLMANKLEQRRAGEAQQRIGIAQQEVDQRGEDQSLDRQLRDRQITAQENNTAALGKYRDAMVNAKTDEDRFKVFNDLIKSGAANQQTLDAMSQEMSKKLGLQVQLKMPEKTGFDTREGHNLALAEKYRERANAARRNGGGDEADRFLGIAERLERGGTSEPVDTAELTQEIGPVDPLTGKGRASLRRKLRGSDIDRAINGAGGVPSALAPDAAAGPTPDEQAQMDEILSRPGIPAGGPVGAGVAPAAPAAAALPRVTTQEQYDRLPSKARYIGRDGRTYAKP